MSGKPLSFWLRRIHKWIGLLIGLQVLLWTLSGAGMALLPQHWVNGDTLWIPAPAPAPAAGQWGKIASQLGSEKVSAISVASLPGRTAYAVSTEGGTKLFDAATAAPIALNRDLVAGIARVHHPEGRSPDAVSSLDRLTLAVRKHDLPIWKATYEATPKRTFYISGATGELLEERDASFSAFDFLWMLHTMDYVGRDSFNHPVIILFAFAAAWLAITGFWLLFKTMWRHDISWLRRRFSGK